MSPKTYREIIKLLWITVSSTIFVLQKGSHANDAEDLKTNSELFCSKGWRPFGQLCFKGFLERRNFENAEEECKKLGGNLAAITSSEIQDFVTVKILLSLEYKSYNGLRYNESTNSFNWTDGSEFEFAAWNDNEPSRITRGHTGEHCAEMTFDDVLERLGRWNDIPCDHELPYICQKFKDQKTEKSEEKPNLCSRTLNGISFRNSCFYLSLHWKTWQEAEKYCVEQYNGHLVSVIDAAVQKFLHYELVKKQAQQSNVWIGIKLQPDDVRLWSSGWYVGYSNWKDKEAETGSSKSCAQMMKGGSGEWILSSCDEQLPFICENSSVIPPPKLKLTVPGLKCPSKEWIDLGGDYCYIIDKKAYVTWYHANFLCMRKGGTLVVIHSEKEEKVLEQFLRLVQIVVHIGLFRHDRIQDKSGEFEWVDNSPISYDHWRYGEPNSKEEVCAEALPHENMQWNDKKCENLGMFICSVAKKAPTPPDFKQVDCECLPTPAIVGVVLCVLIVIILLGVVIYNVKPWMKARQQECKKRKSSFVHERLQYRTGEIIISERIYENMERELHENMESESYENMGRESYENANKDLSQISDEGSFQNLTIGISGRTVSFP